MFTLLGLIGFGIILTIGITALMPMVLAQPPALSMPVDCRIGESCFIQNYVDLDPAEGKWFDYRCGPNTYDGHKGVDFRLRNIVQMREGVSVLAAADGTVLRLRDGMEDISIKQTGAPALEGNDCGNGLVIGHNGGYETQYCHMKRGSLSVAEGQEVKRGDRLGEIGLSGNTEFPHLHFMLRSKDGEIIDPFAGKMLDTACSAEDYHGHFWQSTAKRAMPYIPTALLNMGIASARPDDERARAGAYAQTEFAPDAPALIVWADVMGLQQGDRLLLQIADPKGVALVNHAADIPKNKALWFQFAGKSRSGDEGWPEGEYRGYVKASRRTAQGESQTLFEQQQTFYVSGISAGDKPEPKPADADHQTP